MTKTGLSLSPGQTYFFSVKAVDNLGLISAFATNSNGQAVDTTAPSPPVVRDGTGADIATTYVTQQLSANWDASTDNESGISGYQYAIGTTAGATDTVAWTTLGNVTTVTKTGLSLVIGQTYFFSVRAVNGVGLTGMRREFRRRSGASVAVPVLFLGRFRDLGGAWRPVGRPDHRRQRRRRAG